MVPTRRRSIALFTTLTLAAVPATAVAKGDHGPGSGHGPGGKGGPAATMPTGPASFALPNAFQPEGIASGPGGQLFVGSIPTGAVYRADPRTGQGSVLVPGREGRAAIGLKVEGKQIVVAGGPTGKAFVYDARTGADRAEITLTTSAQTFVNDVAIDGHTAYFTDSQQPQLYRVALGKDDKGKGGPKADKARDSKGKGKASARKKGEARPAAYTATTVPITGDLQYDADPATFEANGIAALPGGRELLVVQSGTGKLFRVNGTTGVSVEVPLTGGNLLNGDGILLKGRTLYVVQNRLNQIAVVRLDGKSQRGTIERVITNPLFRVPTTIARQGGSLFAVNARFGTPATPTTDYDVVRVATK